MDLSIGNNQKEPVNELMEYGIHPIVVDPVADAESTRHEYGIKLDTFSEIKDMDAILIAVGHEEFKKLTRADMDAFYENEQSRERILFDIKGLFESKEFDEPPYRYWRL